MKNKSKRIIVCVVCGARYPYWGTNAMRDVCDRPECYEIKRTGKTMDEIVNEASQMPRDIENNNHDYDEFDPEVMMARREDEP
jgi:hypothetical protein